MSSGGGGEETCGATSAGGGEDDLEEDLRRRRCCLLERLMASFGPASRFVYDVSSHPCILYTMKVSVNKARVSWSHRRSRRFFPERRGPAFRIPLFHVVEHDQVEPVAQKSTVPGEPDRLGILSGTFDLAYQLCELYRVRNVVRMERSSVPWVEVAVIRAIGGGITVTSHVDHLVSMTSSSGCLRAPGPWISDVDHLVSMTSSSGCLRAPGPWISASPNTGSASLLGGRRRGCMPRRRSTLSTLPHRWKRW
jgi:hypothetical protein